MQTVGPGVSCAKITKIVKSGSTNGAVGKAVRNQAMRDAKPPTGLNEEAAVSEANRNHDYDA
jgi:hypothetical protein